MPPDLPRVPDRLLQEARHRIEPRRHQLSVLCPPVEVRQWVEMVPDRPLGEPRPFAPRLPFPERLNPALHVLNPDRAQPGRRPEVLEGAL